MSEFYPVVWLCQPTIWLLETFLVATDCVSLYWNQTPSGHGTVIFNLGRPLCVISNVPDLVLSGSDMIQKIAVTNPVVELDGDEMTRIIWKKIREEVSCVLQVKHFNLKDIELWPAHSSLPATRHQVLRSRLGIQRPGNLVPILCSKLPTAFTID
jgi:hypothetical protein